MVTYDRQKILIRAIFENIEAENREDVWVDGDMILTGDKSKFQTLEATFEMMGLDFSTGEPTQDGEYYYICFA